MFRRLLLILLFLGLMIVSLPIYGQEKRDLSEAEKKWRAAATEIFVLDRLPFNDPETPQDIANALVNYILNDGNVDRLTTRDYLTGLHATRLLGYDYHLSSITRINPDTYPLPCIRKYESEEGRTSRNVYQFEVETWNSVARRHSQWHLIVSSEDQIAVAEFVDQDIFCLVALSRERTTTVANPEQELLEPDFKKYWYDPTYRGLLTIIFCYLIPRQSYYWKWLEKKAYMDFYELEVL